MIAQRLVAVTLAAVCLSILRASGASWRSQETPLFRVGVQVIEVDVRVTDRDRRVVRDLTKDDFTLLDDGVPQTIATASFVDLAIASPVSRRVAESIESDVATNAGAGRRWVILIGSPPGGSQRAQFVARRFVDNALGPNDEVAVILVHGTMSSAQGFTRNRGLLLNAIDRLQHVEPILDPVRTAYQVLEEVSDRLGRMTGGRKAVIYFDPPQFFSPSPQDPASVGAFLDQRDALRAATRNNVAIYVVSTEGLTTELSSPLLLAPGGGRENDPLKAMAGQRVLAEETGGDAIVNSNNFEDGFERFVEDSNQYYLLGYLPTVEHRDGEFHSLTIRVNRPGVTVRARRGYYAPSPAAGPVAIIAAQPDGPVASPATRDALRLPLSMNGLTIDVAAAPFRGPSGDGSVMLTAQVRGEALSLRSGELLEVGYQAMTTEGTITPGAFHVFKLDLSDESRASAESDGLRFLEWMTLPKGRHQVRLAAHQPNGRTGMVVADVEVPDFVAAPMSMSGLVLASERRVAQRTLKTDETLRKVLGAYPTAERAFERRDVLTAYAEVYTNAKSAAARVEATLTRGQGRAQAIATRPIVNEPTRAGYLTRVPLQTLQPGTYVLTLEARAGRQIAKRQLVFTITP